MPSLDEDQQLIESILAGDPQAWEKIVQRFSGMVWRILRGQCRIPEDQAADAFQEIFLALQKENFRRLRQWRGHAPLDAYMVVVVRRLARDFLRADRRSNSAPPAGGRGIEEDAKLLDPEDPDPTPEEAALLAERRQAVKACRERLPLRDQKLLDLRYSLELKFREIAARMKMTLSNVGVALGRAEDRLRRCLQERFPDLFGGWGEGVQTPA